MSHCVLLLNRGSGGNDRGLDSAEVCRIVETAFLEVGHELVSLVVRPKEIDRELARAVASKPEIVIVAGGDGTVSAAARHLGGTGIALGILPMGTFNLAARDLGVPLDIAEAAIFLATAKAFPIDVLEVAGRMCLCTTILGFYPEFSDVFEQRDHGGHWWKKAFKFCTRLRQTFANARPLPLTWESDGGDGHAYTKFSAFVPGRYRQTAGLIPNRTDFCSGKLTAYIGSQKNPAAALRGIFDYAIGRHEQNSEMEVFTASQMTLRAGRRRACKAMIDGEIMRLPFPISLRIRPRYLHVLTTAETLTSEN
jgi:diacylglycerol kinase family enzyme